VKTRDVSPDPFLLFVLVIAVLVMVAGCGEKESNENEPPDARHIPDRRVHVRIDRDSGCHYLYYAWDGRLTPRLDTDGEVMGCGDLPTQEKNNAVQPKT